MKAIWDYTSVAKYYNKRPSYSKKGIEWMFNIAGIHNNSTICDIGAGTGTLTSMLAANECRVIAVEPNDAMRAIGEVNTNNYTNIEWVNGVGEATTLPSNMFDLVTYGSSFNATNRSASLKEAYRILKEDSWIACMWNHRDTDNEMQYKIDTIIKHYLPDYDNDKNGKRHEEQDSVILSSGLFHDIRKCSYKFEYRFSCTDYIESWKSHGTMHSEWKRYSEQIINDIAELLNKETTGSIIVPYITKIWMGKTI